MATKEEQYSLVYKQIASLIAGENDAVSVMANISAMLHDCFGFWWTGFYRVEGGELILGPFQGPVACMHIGYGKGVCGVLDIDSRELETFDEVDAQWLEKIVLLLPPIGSERDICLAAGCFWGAEKYLKLIEGVTFTEVGFANGNTENPTYKEVYTDQTGYAETVHLRYNPAVVSLRFLLEMYFKAIDPTSLNKQGEDEGTRYRTGIYYSDYADRTVIDEVVAEEAKKYGLPLCVEVEPLRNFYPADEYHQDYLDKNPTGYCHLPVALFELAKKAKDTK